MKPELQRIAIAEACGWKPCDNCDCDCGYWIPPTETHWRQATELPDYLNDLNAMHEAENYIKEDTADLHEYAINLTKISAPSVGYSEYSCTEAFKLAHATAVQRAEAFLRTLNLWIA